MDEIGNDDAARWLEENKPLPREEHLDLDKVDLWGFDTMIGSNLTLTSMMYGISQEDDFPPVLVERFGEFDYALVHSEGGHHRAAAHYIMRKPLKVVVIDEGEFHCDFDIYRPIRDHVIRRDWGEYEMLIDEGTSFYRDIL